MVSTLSIPDLKQRSLPQVSTNYSAQTKRLIRLQNASIQNRECFWCCQSKLLTRQTPTSSKAQKEFSMTRLSKNQKKKKKSRNNADARRHNSINMVFLMWAQCDETTEHHFGWIVTLSNSDHMRYTTKHRAPNHLLVCRELKKTKGNNKHCN